MILDALHQLSASQAPTQGATTVSTNSVDLGNPDPNRQIGDGEPMAIVFFIESNTPAADTYTFETIQADDDALTSNVDVLLSSRVLTGAELDAAGMVVIPIAPGTPTKQFIGAQYTLGAADALAVSAFLTPLSFVPKLKDYATAIVIA